MWSIIANRFQIQFIIQLPIHVSNKPISRRRAVVCVSRTLYTPRRREKVTVYLAGNRAPTRELCLRHRHRQGHPREGEARGVRVRSESERLCRLRERLCRLRERLPVPVARGSARCSSRPPRRTALLSPSVSSQTRMRARGSQLEIAAHSLRSRLTA